MQDLETDQPVGAVSIRKARTQDSVLDGTTGEEWVHTMAYSSRPGASHCLNALSPQVPAAPCHLGFPQFWGRDNQGTASWASGEDAPREVVAGEVEWTLGSFQRGSEAYPRLQGEGVARQLHLSDEAPWGMVDENVDHLFPLSTAFRRMANASWGEGEDYGTWLQGQRVASPVSGTLNLTPRATHAEASWRLVVQGDDSFLLMTGRQPFVLVDRGHLGLLLPDDAAEKVMGTWCDSAHRPSSPVRWPRLDESIARVWNTSFVTRPPPVTSWGFLVACNVECPTEGPLVWMDYSADEAWVANPDQAKTRFSAARLLMRPMGEVVQIDFTSNQRFQPDPATFTHLPAAKRPVLTQMDFSVPAGTVPVSLELLAVSGLAAVSVFGIRRWWRHAAAFFGFALGKTSRPESETRQRIRELIQAEPGIHFREVVRRMEISNGTAVHHLGTLIRRRLVRAEERGGYRCFFPAGPVVKEIDAIRALKSEGARRIADALREGPLEIVGLCGRTGLRHTSIAYHVDKMVNAGLIDIQRVTRPRRFALTELGRHLVE